MKDNMHPEYRFVVVRDISCNVDFVTRTAVDPKRFKGSTTVDGVEYPIFQVDISAASHPFFTGEQKVMDTEGRIDAYYRKYGFQQPS
jgi:large subunit ribosomal protein L31